jgi:hypothetical protein
MIGAASVRHQCRSWCKIRPQQPPQAARTALEAEAHSSVGRAGRIPPLTSGGCDTVRAADDRGYGPERALGGGAPIPSHRRQADGPLQRGGQSRREAPGTPRAIKSGRQGRDPSSGRYSRDRPLPVARNQDRCHSTRHLPTRLLGSLSRRTGNLKSRAARPDCNAFTTSRMEGLQPGLMSPAVVSRELTAEPPRQPRVRRSSR